MAAPVRLGPGRGSLLALLLSILLLLTCSIQGAQGGQELRVLTEAGMECATGHPARRVARMTPFWRMVGSKSLGAHCWYSLECITRTCRAGRCSWPRYEC